MERTTGSRGASRIGCLAAIPVVITVAVCIRLAYRLSTSHVDGAASPGGRVQLRQVTTSARSVHGLYTCHRDRPLLFYPTSDSTVGWPLECLNDEWGDKLSSGAGAVPIALTGNLQVPATVSAGPVTGTLRGVVLAPVSSGESRFITRDVAISVPLNFRVMAEVDLQARRRFVRLRLLLAAMIGVAASVATIRIAKLTRPGRATDDRP